MCKCSNCDAVHYVAVDIFLPNLRLTLLVEDIDEYGLPFRYITKPVRNFLALGRKQMILIRVVSKNDVTSTENACNECYQPSPERLYP